MSTPQYVKLLNECEETIKVYLRYPRSPKPFRRTTEIKILPKHESRALPYPLLIGAKDWDLLKKRDCLKITEVPFEPRFLELLNISTQSLSFEIVPATEARTREITKVTIEPEESSRIIDQQSLREPGLLNKLEKEKKIQIMPVLDIGPSTGLKGAVGSFVGESVYICYKCGGPIIFRGSPPKPVHI